MVARYVAQAVRGLCMGAADIVPGVSGGTDEAAKDVSMHVAAMSPAALNIESLDQAEVDRERSILREAALADEGVRRHVGEAGIRKTIHVPDLARGVVLGHQAQGLGLHPEVDVLADQDDRMVFLILGDVVGDIEDPVIGVVHIGKDTG